MTNTIYDITRESDAILLVGSNPEEAHPVLGMQLRQAVQRGARLIVVDPRDIDIAKKAEIHLKLKPGTNVAFANGMMHRLCIVWALRNIIPVQKALCLWRTWL